MKPATQRERMVLEHHPLPHIESRRRAPDMTDKELDTVEQSLSARDRDILDQADKIGAEIAQGKHLEDWWILGDALLIIRREAMRLAHTNEPKGSLYNSYYGLLLKRHPALEKATGNSVTRSNLL